MSITNKVPIELSEQLTSMSAESNSANGSVVDRLFDIMDKSSKKLDANNEALQEGAVYIVGTTGDGKSTLLNYLAGKNLKVINDEGIIKLILENPADGVSSIGSGDGQSGTVNPLTNRDAENEITYIENDGDQDSRGIAQQILNSYFKSNICPKIQILIVASYSSITSDDGSSFVKYLQTFAESLEDVELMSSHISLVFTRVSSITTVKSVLSKLEEMIVSQATNLGESKKILENIVKQEKVGLFIEPENEQIGKIYESPQTEKVGREGILNMLKSGEYAPLPKTGNLFKVAVSDTRDVSNLIVSTIKSTLVQKVAGFENFDAFLKLDEDPLIKASTATYTELKKFFKEKLNVDISEDYDWKQIEILYRLAEDEKFKLNFGSLKEKLNDLNIKDLFNSEPTFETSEKRIVLKGFNVKTSVLKDKILALQSNGAEITQVSVQALNAIDFDEDLNFADFPKFENTKLSIISPIWNLNKDKDTTINLDGKSGANHAVSKALNGTSKPMAANRQNGENGGAGTDGEAGNNGQHGRSFLGVGTKFISNGKKLKISSNGGNSSKGQDGGDGGNGGNGGDYETPSESLPIKDFNQKTWDDANNSSFLVISWAYSGGTGGQGGNSGKGGQGGYAGKAGVLDILIKSNDCIEKKENNGQSCGNGTVGIPGKGGMNGNMLASFSAIGEANEGSRILMSSNVRAANGSTPTVLIEANPQSEQSDVPYSEILSYEKFLTSYFGKKDISRDIALEVLKNFIKRSSPLEIDTSKKLGLKGMIEEVQLLNSLYSDFMNQEEWKLSAKELISLYERSMVKITEFGKTISKSKLDSEALLYLYTTVIMALNSLKSAYTVVNFDYLEYFVKEKVVDYNQIVEREKISASKKEYDQKVDKEIENANEWIKKLNKRIDELNEMLDKQIKGLKDDMKKSQEKKEEYAKQMKTASVLKIASGVMKLVGGLVSCAGPYGAAVGGILSLGGTVVDFATPDLTPLSLKDLDPTTFLQLDDQEDKLIDTNKFIGILKGVYSQELQIKISEEKAILENMNKEESKDAHDKQNALIGKLEAEVPKKEVDYAEKLVEDAAKNPSKFIKDNCLELEKKKKEAKAKLTEEQKIDLNNLELEKRKFQMTKYVTIISSVVQTANNIASLAQDCLSVQKQTEAALKEVEDSKKTQESIRSFMDKSLQGIKDSMKGFPESLAKADSHAHIDYIRYGFKERMQDVIDYFQSALSKYEYSNGDVSKAHLFSVLNKFERLGETLANIQQRIADAEDKKKLANLITAVGEPSSDMTFAYPNILEVSKSLKSHLLAKEGNDILYCMKQSLFPFAPYYSYDYFKKTLHLKDTDVNTVIAGIKAAYESHQLSKYAINQKDKFIKPHAKFILDDPSSKGPFSTWQGADEPAKLTALLNGELVDITADIRNAPQGADAIKFRELNLKLRLNPQGSDKVNPLDQEFQKELLHFNVELTSSGVYHYRYNDKYYNIPSTPVSLNYAYAGGNGNAYYEKIKNGDPIFSPYTTWTVKLTPVGKADSLEKKFGANVADMELALVGEAQYIDMESYEGKAREEIIVNECYEDFVLKTFGVSVLKV